MSTVEFLYNGNTIIIQCQVDEKIEDIIDKFLSKTQKERGSVFFLYSGKTLDEDLAFNEAITPIDKSNNLMKIQAWDVLFDSDACLKKANIIICPECKESALIDIDENYQISLQCRNEHQTYIPFKDFEKSQLIDQSKIKCEGCKIINKGSTPNNSFYRCLQCKLNLCPKCKITHEQEKHIIIDYDDREFYCTTHYEPIKSLCVDCQSEICNLCEEKEHKDHETESIGTVLRDIEGPKKELMILKESIRNLRKDIKEIIAKLNFVIDNLNNYYSIYSGILSNFDDKKRSYMNGCNINILKRWNVDFMRQLSEITIDKNLKTKFSELIRLYEEMNLAKKEEKKENKNEIKEDNIDKDQLIEEEEYKKDIIRYNPLDNKYDNFDLENLEEIQRFETRFDIKFVMVLHDRRLLTQQTYKDEQGDLLTKICIYDLSNGIICDINYDSKEKIYKILQMDDDNIIMVFEDKVKIFKIQKKSLEEIYNNEFIKHDYIYKILSNKILIQKYENFYVYSYEGGELIENINFEIKNIEFENVCAINENEIAIYYSKKGKLYGENAFILFYDIKNNKEIQILKLGNYNNGRQMLLFDEYNLIVERNHKLVLIDPIKKTIKKEFKQERDGSFKKMIALNAKSFLVIDNDDYLYEYEIKNSTINLISSKVLEEKLGCFDKYPDNGFIASEFLDKHIFIYGY